MVPKKGEKYEINILERKWNKSVPKKGFEDFFKSQDADIFCLQETKMQIIEGQETKEIQEILNLPIFNNYHCYWNSAEKKGYSGTAIFTKQEPISVKYGIDIPEHDKEGRVITLEFDKFYMVDIYTPNSKKRIRKTSDIGKFGKMK